MSAEQKKRNTQTTGDGFCLFPWGEHFREGNLAAWSDAAIAVLPVIAAHANRDRKAWPSYDLISAYAHVSKTTVAEALEELIKTGWIVKTEQHGRNTHNRYQLNFGGHDGKSREYIAIHHELVKSGVWGAMRPSERRVYLIFRAFAWAGLSAIWNGYDGSGYTNPEAHYNDECGEPVRVNVRGEWKEFCFTKVQFLPEHIYNPAKFAELSGLPPRTFREARAWLIDNGLICPYVCDEDDSIAGFIMPLFPGIRFPRVLEDVERVKRESRARATAAPGAKRSFAAMLSRAGVGKSTPSTKDGSH